MKPCLKGTRSRLPALFFALLLPVAAPALLRGQQAPAAPAQPPASGSIFPLSQVHRGLKATAWTVFEGAEPEPMDVEILGVLRGGRGPGQDMILARLRGPKPDYTGVVEGMSGSPVYIDGKLLGSLSYRIGQFSKDPIAGITPIEQMLGIRDLPASPAAPSGSLSATAEFPSAGPAAPPNFEPIETPLVMSGFAPDSIRLWQQKMAGSSLATVSAGGMAGASDAGPTPSPAATATLKPGSAISAQLVRGDVEMAATCTITYIDPKQLLACGHPVLQAGPVSLPMTTAEIVATLASPLNSFKIVNTGATVGAFTEDRESGIRGLLGAQARMIPMHIAIDGPDGARKVNVEVVDLPSLTPQAVMVVLYNAINLSNDATAESSYHLTGSVVLQGLSAAPLDIWATPGAAMPAPITAALEINQFFSALYSNGARRGAVRSIDISIETVPRRMQLDLVNARIVSGNLAHAGDTIEVEATIQPWQQPERIVRIPVTLPPRLAPGGIRLLVSDAGTLDRTLEQPQQTTRPAGVDSVLAAARSQHSADCIYVSLLAPEPQASVAGQTLTTLPLSVTNALEAVRASQEINLHGESVELAGEAPAGGVLTGSQILTLHIQSGSGLN